MEHIKLHDHKQTKLHVKGGMNPAYNSFLKWDSIRDCLRAIGDVSQEPCGLCYRDVVGTEDYEDIRYGRCATSCVACPLISCTIPKAECIEPFLRKFYNLYNELCDEVGNICNTLDKMYESTK